ncbi:MULTISPECIES: hypothetical protein [unclassified Roseateles]|uniref:hypothetical protein n=1 Tax=unclassified Roseateles TaxID=2626991 RepID=UPI0012E34FD4|nr:MULTISPECIES: hypothetical protein [unclassified Roseateles]
MLHTQLLALCLASSALVVQADVMPPRPGYVEPPPKQTLVVELESRLDGADWVERKRLMPARQPSMFAPLVEKMKTASGECVVVTLHFFDDGSMRPTGQLLDEDCLVALADWQELNTNGSVAQFSAQTARGAVEMRLVARWVNPPSQGLSKLTRAELSTVPDLSLEQLAQQARQREWLARAMEQDAVDRAWRLARRAK